jgi:hypothetical protein
MALNKRYRGFDNYIYDDDGPMCFDYLEEVVTFTWTSNSSDAFTPATCPAPRALVTHREPLPVKPKAKPTRRIRLDWDKS